MKTLSNMLALHIPRNLTNEGQENCGKAASLALLFTCNHSSDLHLCKSRSRDRAQRAVDELSSLYSIYVAARKALSTLRDFGGCEAARWCALKPNGVVSHIAQTDTVS